MKPVEPAARPNAVIVVYAKNQPPYLPLPVSVGHENIVTEWELSAEELAALLDGGRVRLSIYGLQLDIPGKRMLPLKLEVIEPECGFGELSDGQVSATDSKEEN